jgi:hypothetical protein
MSYKPQVQVSGEGDKWHDNALRFATRDEAHEYAADLFCRWTSATGYRAAESGDPVNYSYVDRELKEVKP